jgi:hypothetical protein
MESSPHTLGVAGDPGTARPSARLPRTVSFSGVEDSSLQTSFVIDDTAFTVS